MAEYNLKKGKNNIKMIIKNKITNLSKMFYECYEIEDIKELRYLNTKYCNNFSYMIYECSSLSDIKPLKKWNVSNCKKFNTI